MWHAAVRDESLWDSWRQSEEHRPAPPPAYLLSQEFSDLSSFQAPSQILSCDSFVQSLREADLGFPLHVHLWIYKWVGFGFPSGSSAIIYVPPNRCTHPTPTPLLDDGIACQWPLELISSSGAVTKECSFMLTWLQRLLSHTSRNVWPKVLPHRDWEINGNTSHFNPDEEHEQREHHIQLWRNTIPHQSQREG